MEQKLIKLNNSKIVNPSEILKAERCGNYTDVWLKDSTLVMQIWDEEKIVWNAILEHVA